MYVCYLLEKKFISPRRPCGCSVDGLEADGDQCDDDGAEARGGVDPPRDGCAAGEALRPLVHKEQLFFYHNAGGYAESAAKMRPLLKRPDNLLIN
jgi:hypothetical protein